MAWSFARFGDAKGHQELAMALQNHFIPQVQQAVEMYSISLAQEAITIRTQLGIAGPHGCYKQALPSAQKYLKFLSAYTARTREILLVCSTRIEKNGIPAEQETSESTDLSAISPAEPTDSSMSSAVAPKTDELVLFLVAAFWGTNPVCLRFTYLLDQPPSPAALAAVQATGAAFLLTLASSLKQLQTWSTDHRSKPSLESGLGREDFEAQAPHREALPGPFAVLDPISRAGLEIGAWTFLANAATISAFQHTPASRGAFLIRLTAVFTPAVSKLVGQSVSKREWTACTIALAGGILISLDSALNSDSSVKDAALGLGDAVMVLSACLWAVQTVRLSHHAGQHDQLKLARNQTVSLAFFSILWLAGLAVSEGPGFSVTGSLVSSSTPPIVWAAVLWPAIGPWGIATALQVRAQRSVSASRTQIILATDPLWATGFATLLGSAEQGLGILGWVGAAFVLSASAVARH